MDTFSIVAVTAAVLSILSAFLSFRKIKLQRNQEKELLKRLDEKSSNYLKELIKHLEDGESIESINEIEGNLTETEMKLRDRLFEKHVLSILRENQLRNFSEIKNAMYQDEKINTNYLNKIHNILSNKSTYKTYSENKNSKINELIFQIEELKVINAKLKDKLNKSTKEEKIEVRLIDKIIYLEANEVTHITAEDDGCRIHSIKDSYWVHERLKTIKDKLNENFIQVHRTTIINIEFVVWVNHTSLKLSNGLEIKIGRTYKHELKEGFNSN